MTPAFDTVFSEDEIPAYPLAIIALPGAEEFAEKVDKYLVDWYGRECAKKTPASFIVPTNFPRFTSGDGKAMILDSVRGKDLYVVIDTGNHGVQYKMFGQMQCMSPDDHFQNLKRLISAVGGKASRITVVMPLLYGGRQHRRNARESLDCAIMLRELEVMGVKDLITFDAHDPRVQNAVPLMGFARFRRRHDHTALPFSDWRDKVDFADCEVVFAARVFKFQTLVGINGDKVVKARAFSEFFRGHAVDGIDD